jgi:hypothetical protein
VASPEVGQDFENANHGAQENEQAKYYRGACSVQQEANEGHGSNASDAVADGPGLSWASQKSLPGPWIAHGPG